MDGNDKNGNEVLSEEEDDYNEEDFDEEGEEEIDEETFRKLKAEAAARGEDLEYDDEDEYGDEEGEDEYGDEDDDDDQDDHVGDKRAKGGNGDGAAAKRKK